MKEDQTSESENLIAAADFALWAIACEGALWPVGTFWSAYCGKPRRNLLRRPAPYLVDSTWTPQAANGPSKRSEPNATTLLRKTDLPTNGVVVSG
jgi:hypothetical protein